MTKSKRPSPARKAIAVEAAKLSEQIDATRSELEKLQKAGKIKQAELRKEELDRFEEKFWRVQSPFLAHWPNWHGSPSDFKFYGPDAFPGRIFQYCQPEYRSDELQIT